MARNPASAIPLNTRAVIYERHGNKPLGERVYHAAGQTMTEAAIDTGFTGDLYVSLGEPVADGAWGVRLYRKPFVDWIWGGCFLMAIGGFFALSDRRYRARALAAAPEPARGAAPTRA